MFQTIEGSGRNGTGGRDQRTASLRTAKERILRAADASALTDEELLAALLGIRVDEAGRLLKLQGGRLLRLFSEGPWAVAALSPARRTRFLAVRELACRLAAERVCRSEPLLHLEDMAHYLALRYSVRDQEVLGALFLSTSGTLLAEGEIYRGTLDSARVEPREILKRRSSRGRRRLRRLPHLSERGSLPEPRRPGLHSQSRRGGPRDRHPLARPSRPRGGRVLGLRQ